MLNIAVCIKQVPDTSEIRINPETNTLIRQGVPCIINPFDENALEEALRLREQFGGTITALCMGPPQAESSLRDALALGIDHAVLLSDNAFAGSDTWATSHVLSLAIRKLGKTDLILCGRQAIDGDTAQVGPGIAEHLQMPAVTRVRRIQIEKDSVSVERVLEDGIETVEVRLPALFTVVKEINVPRLPGIKGKLASRKCNIPVWKASDIGIPESGCGLAGSPTFVKKIFTPTFKGQGEILQGEPSFLASEVVARLKKLNLIRTEQ